MDLGDLIKPDNVLASAKAESKKDLLLALAERCSVAAGLEARQIYDALWHRERLGSTGLGKGVAIPHARMADLKSIMCVFARLEEPLAFDAVDGEPVDLVFVLLAPEAAGADHLQALARISRLIREPAAIEKLRGAKSRGALYSILTEPLTSSNAA